MLPTPATAPDERIDWRASLPFLAFHLVPLAAIFTGVSRRALVLAVVLYVARVFFITAGYHRYFAHRSYRLGRVPQLLMAVGGLTAVQKGPLWWASHHRAHHRYADTERDPHSPQKGFWWSHIGWVLSGKYGKTDLAAIDDFARFPELRFLDRHDWIGPWALGVVSFLIAGWSGLVVGFFASTVVLSHVTFSVNSVTHLVGRRRYATTDTSRNFAPVALLSLGEGWHNNHHHYPGSARQGFFWWEFDPTFLVLRALSWVRIVRDLRHPPASARQARRVRDGHPDVGAFRQHLARAAATMASEELTVSAEVRQRLVDDLAALAERATAEAKNERRVERVGAAASRSSTPGAEPPE